MKFLLSWSSGKDSAWALHVLNQRHPGTVGALLTTINESVDRVAMHAVRRDVLAAQAAAAGLPLRVVPIPEACSNEIYEARMGAAVAAAVKEGFTHAAFWRSLPGRRSPVPGGAPRRNRARAAVSHLGH